MPGMPFEELARTSEQVAATRSRLAKRALLAAALGRAAPDELELVVTYLSGTLRQRRTGVGWAALTDLPAPAGAPTLTVTEVDRAFEAVAGHAGSGSAARRSQAMAELFGRATDLEQRLLRGLIFDEVRQGALDALVQDGVAEAFGVPVAAVQRAAMLLGSTPAAARLAREGGLAALEAVRLRVGQPVRPMLAASAADPSAALLRTGVPAVADAKLDGIRVQVHRDGGTVRLYTRTLDDITDRLPEVVDAVLALPTRDLVLDGEVVGLRPDGRPLPFQVIASRTATSVDVAAGRDRTPLRLFAFDLLRLDGRDLLDEPLEARVALLADLLPADEVVPRRSVGSADELAAVFADVVAQGYEGLVVKNPQAPYAAGRRDAAWVKVKPRHTFDLAVTAAEWGHGRREGWLSNLHLAAVHQDTGALVMLGKTFKGLTDQLLQWQTEQLLAREVRRTRGTVHVDPPPVVEIACDGVQRSTRYPGGIALRFARVLRYRDDKTVADVDTLATVLALNPLEEDAPGSG
ncbi:ATP-dependent DNA ligase [Nakamurella endophytica]|uniref:DNA ligase n=2 Tax=Nakamurella endophytica TaxID=1748367 RepID=A0A917WEH6_9ACTN|nr:ATP-dependent DNA ligase [Nakamurella endophytica]GGL99899.1 putative DNA ligase [Nakamurella endophytica]